MAVSFQNIFFNNPLSSNGLENLKPRISKEPNDSSNKTGDKNTKADTQEAVNNQPRQNILDTNPIDKAYNNLANKILSSLINATKDGTTSTADSLLESIGANHQLPKSTLESLNGSSFNNLTSFEFTQSITYTLSYNSQSGEYSQSLQYSASFVATFNAEFTDKNGNKMLTQNQLALGKNLENQLTNGQESLSSALKEFLEGQTFNVDFDGDLNQIGNHLQQGLNNMLFLFESTGDSISKILQNTQNPNPQENMSALFSDLQNMLNSSLEMFVGIPKKEQNNPTLTDLFKNQNALTITASYEQYNAQWIGKKLDNSSLFFGSLSAMSASFKFEA